MSDLDKAWARLTVPDLVQLLREYIDPRWTVSPSTEYAVGPCPRGFGNCSGEPAAAWVRASNKGMWPWVRCNHQNTCAYAESLWQLLADGLGTERAATEIVLNAAALKVTHEARRRFRQERPARRPSPVRADDDYEERAAILEYDAGLPRHAAEGEAARMTRRKEAV